MPTTCSALRSTGIQSTETQRPDCTWTERWPEKIWTLCLNFPTHIISLRHVMRIHTHSSIHTSLKTRIVAIITKLYMVFIVILWNKQYIYQKSGENGETHPRAHVSLERKERFKWTKEYKVPQAPGYHHLISSKDLHSPSTPLTHKPLNIP